MSRVAALHVWRDRRLVGTLWRGVDDRLIGFEYDADWMANGLPISHSLPLDQACWLPEAQLAHRWFGNLLPEERARAALVRRLGLPDDDFALLEALGGDCAGALVILPPDEVPEPEGDSIPLGDVDLANWAAFRDRYAVMGGEDGQRPRLSLAGAQDKLPVLLEGDAIRLPRGGLPSSHILKFAVDGREIIVLNELYLNTLARLVGLPCPETRIRYAGRHPYLLVARYDRTGIGTPDIARVHQEDFCQAMGLARTDKYQAHGGPRFGDCVTLVRRACRPSAQALRQLLSWQLFNVLVGNSDGHAKNLSLLQDTRGRWQLAPAYDLVGTIVLGFQADLAFSIGGQFNSQQLLKRDWEAFARECGFGSTFVHKEIAALSGRLETLAASDELRGALEAAGLEERGWVRLQQQRHHIQRQCRRAQAW